MDPSTIGLDNLELGTQMAPIIIPDSPPLSPIARSERRKGKQRLRVTSKSTSPVLAKKPKNKISPTSSLPSRFSSSADYNNFICRNCKEHGHRHKNCPTYHCRICHEFEPGHLSFYCSKLKKAIVREPPPMEFTDTDFYVKLAAWEANLDDDERNKRFDEYEDSGHCYEFSDDPIYYHNQDD
jgi:hypothetical protein